MSNYFKNSTSEKLKIIMLNLNQLNHIHPLICTPSHDGKYFHNYILSLLNTIATANQLGVRIQVSLMAGESLVTRARNNAVATFLENPEWTHLFWIDSDIGFSPQAFFRLLQADRDVACGVYPLKYEKWPEAGIPAQMTYEEFRSRYARYTVNTDAEEDNIVRVKIDSDGFFPVTEAPTGFMAIKRSVFERMIQNYPELQYVSDSIGFENKNLHYRFFDCMVHPISKRYLSEDYTFCYLWNKIGGQIFIDANSNLTHEGKKIYTGSFGETLKLDLGSAVGAPPGLPMQLFGGEFISPNEKGPD